MNRIYKSLDESKHSILISIDFWKAFDVIRHDILIGKLEHIGIRGFMLKWFDAYLSNRSQQTQANLTLSEPLQVKTDIFSLKAHHNFHPYILHISSNFKLPNWFAFSRMEETRCESLPRCRYGHRHDCSFSLSIRVCSLFRLPKV